MSKLGSITDHPSGAVVNERLLCRRAVVGAELRKDLSFLSIL